jgi:ankyrin repeat protein
MITKLKPLKPREKEFVDAATSGDVSRVRELLERGVPVDVLDNRDAPMGKTALMHAAKNGHLDVVKVLLEASANVSAKDKAVPTFPEITHAHQPLHYAAMGGNLGVINSLLAASADVNALNTFGNTPLNVAIQHGHLGAVRVLLGRGAKLNFAPKKKRYFPPLCVAASAKQLEIFRELLKAGADVNAANPLNQTPLNCAAAAPEEVAIPMIEELLKAGAKIDNVVDKLGGTALYHAVFQNSTKVVRLLAQAGAEVNRVFKSQRGTLLDAAERRVQSNQRTLDDPKSAEWEKNGAKHGLEKWEAMFDLLQELGAKQQSKL